MRLLNVGGNKNLKGRIESVLKAVPRICSIDIDGTGVTADNPTSAATALAKARDLNHYAIGGADFTSRVDQRK